jgi:hypothetical protein
MSLFLAVLVDDVYMYAIMMYKLKQRTRTKRYVKI